MMFVWGTSRQSLTLYEKLFSRATNMNIRPAGGHMAAHPMERSGYAIPLPWEPLQCLQLHPTSSNTTWWNEIPNKWKWWHSYHGDDQGKPYLCLKGKDKGGLTKLPFWMEGLTHNFTFTSNMIIPSRGQCVLKYSSMCLIIQLHPHIPVTHSLQFSSEKTGRA